MIWRQRSLCLSIRFRSTDSAATQLSDGWSQAAASFAALTQSSNNPHVAAIQGYLGQVARDAFELQGRSTEIEGMLRDMIATL